MNAPIIENNSDETNLTLEQFETELCLGDGATHVIL